MVEVFKTDIKDRRQAILLVQEIHGAFPDYQANFDLEDCDRILRVKSSTGMVESCRLIDLLDQLGCQAKVLPDIIQEIALAGKGS